MMGERHSGQSALFYEFDLSGMSRPIICCAASIGLSNSRASARI
jgi:hypothetical protein